jgi:hypothetical protein
MALLFGDPPDQSVLALLIGTGTGFIVGWEVCRHA